jgi:N-acetyl-anhydromuramyl-L-alanine amidase AmpD
MNDIIKFGNFTNFEKNKSKRQIILCNSFRGKLNYLNSLKYRNNKKIPNYFISSDGEIVSLLPEDSYSNFFNDTDVNKNSIIICLENFGWLSKLPIEAGYSNWIGDIYSGKIYERKWRDKIYWASYKEPQINSLVELCQKITKKFSINKTFIGHNTKVDGIKIFNGIVCRSNYDNKFTDLSPAFDFEGFKTRIENE